MAKKKTKNNIFDTKYNFVLFIIALVLIIQSICTSLTNTKIFSIKAFFRNLLWAFSFYLIYKTKNFLWIFVPIAVMLMYNYIFAHLLQIKIQPSITTQYLYNDLFEYVVKDNKSLNYYTEGDYSKILNVDTMDLSQENIDKIMNWGKRQYDNAYLNKPIYDFNNKTIDIESFQHNGQRDKCKWIVDNLNITNSSRVLEIGFGKLDLMKYIRDNTGANVVGCNIAKEHVDDAINNGFQAYQIDFKRLKNNLDKLGKFDTIITDGSLEYLRNGDSETIFDEFMNTINMLLNPGGKWYTTTIHYTKDNNNNNIFALNGLFDKNWYNFYNLAFGNEGYYPIYPDGLTKYADKNKLKVVKQENRWLDYYIFSIIYMCNSVKANAFFKDLHKHLNALIAAPNYLESYLCYTPFKNMFHLQPWIWQFTQQKNGKVPTYHQWIIFQKI